MADRNGQAPTLQVDTVDAPREERLRPAQRNWLLQLAEWYRDFSLLLQQRDEHDYD